MSWRWPPWSKRWIITGNNSGIRICMNQIKGWRFEWFPDMLYNEQLNTHNTDQTPSLLWNLIKRQPFLKNEMNESCCQSEKTASCKICIFWSAFSSNIIHLFLLHSFSICLVVRIRRSAPSSIGPVWILQIYQLVLVASWIVLLRSHDFTNHLKLLFFFLSYLFLSFSIVVVCWAIE